MRRRLCLAVGREGYGYPGSINLHRLREFAGPLGSGENRSPRIIGSPQSVPCDPGRIRGQDSGGELRSTESLPGTMVVVVITVLAVVSNIARRTEGPMTVVSPGTTDVSEGAEVEVEPDVETQAMVDAIRDPTGRAILAQDH